MFSRYLFNGTNLFGSGSNKVRSFTQKVVPNPVFQYFLRAKLIDSIRLSLRSRSPESVLPLLQNPNIDSFVVANALRSAPSPESALSLLDALHCIPSFSHTQHSLHAVAKVLANSGRTARLKRLVEAINGGDFKNVPPVSILDRMRWYAACGDLESVLCVWGEFGAQGKSRSIESYNLVMGLYVEMGKDLEAVQTFRNMIQRGLIPNSRTFTIVIQHLVNSGKAEVSKEVFDTLPLMRVKHTLKQYFVLVRTFCNLERFDVVKSLLRQMRIEGLMPPRSMLAYLQHTWEEEFLQESEEFLKEMVPDDRIKKIALCMDHSDDEGEEGVDDHGSDPEVGAPQLKPWLDPSALASALRHWTHDDVSALEAAKLVWTSRLVCKMIRHFKSSQTAWQFFCWVGYQPGFKHGIHTYSRLITKLVSQGKVDLADGVLSKVKTEGIKLGVSTVRQMMDFYGIFKKGEAALRLFQDVKVLCVHLSESDMLMLYSSLLRTLIKCERDFDAMNVVDQMCSLGIHPDVQTFSGLMHHFAIKGNFGTVHKLFGMVRQSGIEPDAYMYRILIRAYCNHGKATLALRLYENMRTSNLKPDGATKSMLVKSLWREGRLRVASILEEACKEIDHNLPRPSTALLFNVNSSDLIKVYNLYCSSFQDSNDNPSRGELDVSTNLPMGDYFHGGSHNRDRPAGYSPSGGLMGPHKLHLGKGTASSRSAGPSRLVEPPFAPHIPFGEAFGGEKPGHPLAGEPAYFQRYACDGDFYQVSIHAQSLMCRICKVECGTVEGLDLHSQTREHQRKAVDMVRSINYQNKKSIWLHDLYNNEVCSSDAIRLVPSELASILRVKEQQYPMRCDSLQAEIKLLSEPFKIFEFEFWKSLDSHGEVEQLIKPTADGRVNAILSWWVLQLDKRGRIFYSTAPKWVKMLLTHLSGGGNWCDHWKQCVWFVPEKGLSVSKGEDIHFRAVHSDITILYDLNIRNQRTDNEHNVDQDFHLILSPERIATYSDTRWRHCVLSALQKALHGKDTQLWYVIDDSIFLAKAISHFCQTSQVLLLFPGLREKSFQYLEAVAKADGLSVDHLKLLDHRKNCITMHDTNMKHVVSAPIKWHIFSVKRNTSLKF